MTYGLSSWSSFFPFLETEVFHASIKSRHAYIWRGQRRSDWSISSSLDRLLQKLNFLSAGPKVLEHLSAEHLKSFAYAARGRRGTNPRKTGPGNATTWRKVGTNHHLTLVAREIASLRHAA